MVCEIFKNQDVEGHCAHPCGKTGVFKDHLDTDDLSIGYLDAFLLETCRGRMGPYPVRLLRHSCGGYKFLSCGLGFGCLILLGNLPFVAIQRYNRIRC